MPEIFSKNCTIRLIEYGSQQQGLETVEEIKNKITGFLSTIVKK